jgi:hypothetical protein
MGDTIIGIILLAVCAVIAAHGWGYYKGKLDGMNPNRRQRNVLNARIVGIPEAEDGR